MFKRLSITSLLIYAVLITSETLCEIPPLSFIADEHAYIPQIYAKGSNTPLECNAESRPIPTYSWLKQDQLVQSNITHTKRLSNIQLSDGGEYRCIATNPLGAIRSPKIVVNVGYMDPPVNAGKRIFLNKKPGVALVFPAIQVKAYPPATATWTRNNAVIHSSLSECILDDQRLVILDLSASYADSVVRATLSNGYESTKVGLRNSMTTPTYIIGVRAGGSSLPGRMGPELIVGPQDQTVVIYKSQIATARFECVFNARPLRDLRVRWYKLPPKGRFQPRQLLPPDDVGQSYRYSLDTFNRSLNIFEVVPGDAGTYECEGSLLPHPYSGDIRPAVRSSASLRLVVPPTLADSAMEIIAVDYGVRRRLRCQVKEASPSPVFRWFWNARLVGESRGGGASVLNPRWKVEQPGGGLIISNVQSSDSGVFQCFAINEGGEAFRSVWLNVSSFPPRIVTAIANVSSVEGSHAQLDCLTEGSPEPLIEWFKDGPIATPVDVGPRVRIAKENGSLIFNSAKTTDEGFYLCRATNVKGSVNATSQFVVMARTHISPRVNRPVKAVLGSRLILPCPIVFDPRAALFHSWYHRPLGSAQDQQSWQKMGSNEPFTLESQPRDASLPTTKTVDPEAPCNTLEKEHSGQPDFFSLEIPVVSKQYAGSYQCRVTSSAGNDSSVVSVGVISPPEPPLHLTAAVNSSIGCVDLNWRLGSTGDSPLFGVFLHTRKVDEDWKTTEFLDVHRRSHRVCNLKAFTKYQFALSTRNAVGSSGISKMTSSIKLPQKLPTGSPRNVVAFTISSSSIQLNWDPIDTRFLNGNIFKYQIRIHPMNLDKKEGNLKNVKPGSSTSLVLTGLKPFTDYQLTVAAVNARGVGPDSFPPTLARTDQISPPRPPSYVKLDFVNNTAVRVFFRLPEDSRPTGSNLLYYVRVTCQTISADCIDRQVTLAHAALRLVTLSQTISVVVGGLLPAGKYRITLVAKNDAGESPPSYPVKVTFRESIPGPVEQLRVTEIRSKRVRINWSAPAKLNGELKGYYLNYSVENASIIGSASYQSVTLPASINAKYLRHLLPSSWYLIHVTPFTKRGRGPTRSVTIKMGVKAVKPLAPTAPKISKIETDRVTITFRPRESANGLTNSDWFLESQSLRPGVELSKKTPLKWTSLDVDLQPGLQHQRQLPWQTLVVTGLAAHTRYRLRISASNAIGRSEPSPVSDWFTTKLALPAAFPKSVQIVLVNDTCLKIIWMPISPNDWNGPPLNYHLSYQQAPFSLPRVLLLPWTQSSLLLRHLSPATNYTVRVSAVNSLGRGPASPVLVGTTYLAAPSGQLKKGSLRVHKITAREATINWSLEGLPTDRYILGYKVYYWPVDLTNQKAPFVEVLGVANVTVQLTGLYWATYNLRVVPFNLMGAAPPHSSAQVSFRTRESVPDPPTNVHFAQLEVSKVLLVWSPATIPRATLLGYSVRYWPRNPRVGPVIEDSSLGPNVRQYWAVNLTQGAQYEFKVRVRSGVGASAPAVVMVEMVSNRQLPATPTSPIIIQSASYPNSVTLTWFLQWPVDRAPVRNYTLQFRSRGPPSRQYRTSTSGYFCSEDPHWRKYREKTPALGEETRFPLIGLRPFCQYEVRVAAIGDWGRGTFSAPSRVFTVAANVPSLAPTHLSVRRINRTNLLISWKSIPASAWNGPPQGHRILLNGAHWRPIYRLLNLHNPLTRSAQIFLPSPAMLGPWWITVAAVTVGRGPGPSSPPLMVQLGEMPVEEAPGQFRCAGVSSSQIQCNWLRPSSVENLLGYKIFYTEQGMAEPVFGRRRRRTADDITTSGDGEFLVPADSQKCVVWDLRPFRRYSLTILAFNAAGEGIRAGPVVLATLEGRPRPLTSLHLLDMTMTSVKVRWSQVVEPRGRIKSFRLSYWINGTTADRNNSTVSRTYHPNEVAVSNPSIDQLQIQLRNLKRNTTYQVSVQACSGAGWGASTTLSLTTGPRSGCPLTPVMVKVARASSSNAPQPQGYRLHWRLDEGLVSDLGRGGDPILAVVVEARKRGAEEDWFEVEYLRSPQQTYEISYKKLWPDTDYQFRVIAANKVGISAPSYPSQWTRTPAYTEAPLYRQWWFLLLVGFCIGIILLLTGLALCVAGRTRRSKANKSKSLMDIYDHQQKPDGSSYLTVNSAALVEPSETGLSSSTSSGRYMHTPASPCGHGVGALTLSLLEPLPPPHSGTTTTSGNTLSSFAELAYSSLGRSNSGRKLRSPPLPSPANGVSSFGGQPSLLYQCSAVARPPSRLMGPCTGGLGTLGEGRPSSVVGYATHTRPGSGLNHQVCGVTEYSESDNSDDGADGPTSLPPPVSFLSTSRQGSLTRLSASNSMGSNGGTPLSSHLLLPRGYFTVGRGRKPGGINNTTISPQHRREAVDVTLNSRTSCYSPLPPPPAPFNGFVCHHQHNDQTYTSSLV